MKLFSWKSKEKIFWDWFIKNKNEIQISPYKNSKIIQQLSEKLSEYKNGLTFELSSEVEGNTELIISADGIKELFVSVELLVRSAPKLEGWRVLAYRPRLENFEKFKLTYAGVEFDPEKIWIYPVQDDDGFDLILYLPDLNEDNRNILISGSYILLDMALGEFDVVTGIRYLDHHKLPENPEEEGLIPFVELRRVFDSYKAKEA